VVGVGLCCGGVASRSGVATGLVFVALLSSLCCAIPAQPKPPRQPHPAINHQSAPEVRLPRQHLLQLLDQGVHRNAGGPHARAKRNLSLLAGLVDNGDYRGVGVGVGLGLGWGELGLGWGKGTCARPRRDPFSHQ